MKYESPWKVRDKEAFERSVAATFPNGELLTKAVVEKFDADIRVHPGGWSASKLCDKVEQVWEYGRVSIRYRLLPATQQVEVNQCTKPPEFPVFISGDCTSCTTGIGIFETTNPLPNKSIDPMTSSAVCQRYKFLAVDALLVTAHRR